MFGRGSVKAKLGCVPIAIGQIMWKWKWPTNTRIVGNNGGFYYDRYNWDMMPSQLFRNSPEANINEVAKFLFRLSRSLSVDYGCNGNGYEGTWTNSNYHAAAFRQFGFSSTSERRNKWGAVLWNQLIRNELNVGRPVSYGCNRHAYVVSGYDKDDNDLFYVNMGWGPG